MSAPGSTLLFLHTVPAQPTNTKVRFLGCVTSYDVSSATVVLTHPPSPVSVAVNIAVLASGLAFGALRDGEWVHVVGYTADGGGVDAVMLWSAAAVDLGGYERALREKLESEG